MAETPAIQQNTKEWGNSLLGCFSDCKSCCCGLLCLPCLACQVASRLDESCGCCACMCPGGLLAMRTKLRTLYGISGSICNDAMASWCCMPCMVCQMDREMTELGL